MTKRYALREDQWEQIKDLLPGRAGTSLPKTIGYLLKRYRSCIPWRDLPEPLVILESYTLALVVGLKQACGRGFLKHCHMTLTMNMPRWTQPLCVLINTVLEKKDQAIRRSKGGLSTKIHARTDALGNPTGFYLTAG